MSLTQKHQTLIRLLEKYIKEDGKNETLIPALSFFKESEKVECTCLLHEPSVCFIARGQKQIELEDESYMYDANSYLVTSVHLPVNSKIIQASPQESYLSLKLRFSVDEIIEVATEMEKYMEKPCCKSSCDRGVLVGKTDEAMLDSLIRLVSLLETPKDIPFFAPLIIKEILFRLISQNPHRFVKQFAALGSYSHRMVCSIKEINARFSEPLRIDDLAQKAGMSNSLFHRNFKKMTAMSPIQYQKKLRLQEARRLLLGEQKNAAEVAFEVGYESPSQFSREYTRMFGLPPISDIKRSKSGKLISHKLG